jgi:SAM-dependent methyltransferase
MHHWADPKSAMAEIGRVLPPGARALIWDLRPGLVPFHAHVSDPRKHTHGSPLRVVSATLWRWPWRLPLTQRIELVHADDVPADRSNGSSENFPRGAHTRLARFEAREARSEPEGH